MVADLVRNTTENESAESCVATFTIVREVITIATPFAGLLNTMPAIFSLVAEIRAKGIEVGETVQRRASVLQPVYLAD